ncbi:MULTISPECIES: hypothetical protein [unclassified Fusibacter]|uniref:hypothetical protein n=1 Tax=unclassified Fusibacter TaxID=2624464 RepID=UPI0010125D0B|nr:MULTISPECIES: hypothetical protein [unclassified Fusibacter]MCK8058231.1 hypothetical protein [Fusibacter sp. A2]NPE20814.1 hypothetical protein [Fusibacter sp. A1]RXV63018.1 hypothetical protein DWB64_03195 [Fusibacter sp. A1]
MEYDELKNGEYFAFAGMMIWCGVIYIRGTGVVPDRLLDFSHIGPNLGSALVLSETVHAVFLGASFDWKDIAASIVGLGVIALVVNSGDLDGFIPQIG